MKTTRTIRLSAIAAFCLCAALFDAAVASADTVSDDFSGASIDGQKWFLPPETDEGGQLVQAGGKLSFTGAVSSSARPEAYVASRGLGTQLLSWSVEVDVTLQGGSNPFPGMTSNDGVTVYLQVEPVGIGGIYPGHLCEFNLGFLDSTPFGGSGFGHVLRHNAMTNDVSNETLLALGNSDWRTLRLRMEYDAVNKKLKSLYDAGSGFVSFGAVADTSQWNMQSGDLFLISIGGGAFTLDDTPPTSPYTIGVGQAYFDNFNAAGVAVIPEPAFGAPMALLALALVRATSNRLRQRVH